MARKKKLIGGLAVCAVLVAAAPASADASGWHGCGPGTRTVEHDVHGVYMTAWGLRVRNPMNCASGHYALRMAMRKWTHRMRLPRQYWDGYVTWHKSIVRRTSRYSGTAQYTEYATGTAFRFKAQVYSD